MHTAHRAAGSPAVTPLGPGTSSGPHAAPPLTAACEPAALALGLCLEHVHLTPGGMLPAGTASGPGANSLPSAAPLPANATDPVVLALARRREYAEQIRGSGQRRAAVPDPVGVAAAGPQAVACGLSRAPSTVPPGEGPDAGKSATQTASLSLGCADLSPASALSTPASSAMICMPLAGWWLCCKSAHSQFGQGSAVKYRLLMQGHACPLHACCRQADESPTYQGPIELRV